MWIREPHSVVTPRLLNAETGLMSSSHAKVLPRAVAGIVKEIIEHARSVRRFFSVKVKL